MDARKTRIKLGITESKELMLFIEEPMRKRKLPQNKPCIIKSKRNRFFSFSGGAE